MTREELVQRRTETYEEYKRLVALGDYSADTSSIRMAHRTNLDILQHLIDSVKKPRRKKCCVLGEANAD